MVTLVVVINLWCADRVDRLDFSNETTSGPGNLPQARCGLAAVSSSSYGYFGGGETPSQTLSLAQSRPS